MCLGERHSEIIGNQRTAITQLRERVVELEQAKPPIGSHQATLKELSRVRHELLKVKSSLPRGKLNEGAATKPKDQQASKPQVSTYWSLYTAELQSIGFLVLTNGSRGKPAFWGITGAGGRDSTVQ